MDPKKPKSDYIADDYQNSRLILYDDLFIAWEELLEFQVDGRDYGINEDDKPGQTRSW